MTEKHFFFRFMHDICTHNSLKNKHTCHIHHDIKRQINKSLSYYKTHSTKKKKEITVHLKRLQNWQKNLQRNFVREII